MYHEQYIRERNQKISKVLEVESVPNFQNTRSANLLLLGPPANLGLVSHYSLSNTIITISNIVRAVMNLVLISSFINLVLKLLF
jgi:hypothetical protein